MRPEGRRSRRSLLVLAIIVIGVVERAQEVGKGPLGDVAALLAGDHIREPEVDALVDAHVDHIGGGIREAIVGARLLGGGGVRGGDCERHFVSAEVEGEDAGDGTGDIVCSG
jgi:hypothetical protein